MAAQCVEDLTELDVRVFKASGEREAASKLGWRD